MSDILYLNKNHKVLQPFLDKNWGNVKEKTFNKFMDNIIKAPSFGETKFELDRNKICFFHLYDPKDVYRNFFIIEKPNKSNVNCFGVIQKNQYDISFGEINTQQEIKRNGFKVHYSLNPLPLRKVDVLRSLNL